MVNLIGLLVLALFGFLGYRRGILSMACSFTALLIAGIWAPYVAPLLAPLMGFVPLALGWLAGAVVGGLLLFVLADYALHTPLRRRAKRRKEEELPALTPGEALAGIVPGMIWGCVLMGLVLGGVSAIGRAQRAMRRAQAELDYRVQHPGPWVRVDDSKLGLAPAQGAELWVARVDDSFFAPVVNKVTPIDQGVEQTLGDFNVAVQDPTLNEKLCQHPKVQSILQDPRMLELAQDPEIQSAVRGQDVQALMNHPKIAALLQDKEFLDRFLSLHRDRVIDELRQNP